MYATHLHPRRSLTALLAAAVAAIALAIPVRLVADDIGSGGTSSSGAAPVTAMSPQLPLKAKPYWVQDPLASPLQPLEAPVAATTTTAE